MSGKTKGTNAERQLLHLFWQNGWACIRAAGSGSTTHPCPDILASNAKRTMAIECKAAKSNKKYLLKKEIDELKRFSLLFGAESWVAVKFDNKSWYFFKVNDLEKSKGKVGNYYVSLETAKSKGYNLEQIIKLS